MPQENGDQVRRAAATAPANEPVASSARATGAMPRTRGASVIGQGALDVDEHHLKRLPRLDRDATLGQHLRVALAPWTSKVMVGAFAAAVTGRIRAGRFRRSDALTAGALIALEPFTEWLIHVYVLHAKPFEVAGRWVDPSAGRNHRRHHLDPDDPAKVFVPPEDLAQLAVTVGAVTALMTRDRRGRLTIASTALGLLCVYEWTHYLVHTKYQPKSRYYRGIWRAHRWHHFRNEHYWFGITNNTGDRVLGTMPDKSEVPKSGTVRTLGVNSDDGADWRCADRRTDQ